MPGKEFMVENARLVFRNFSGKEGKYNREGDQSFSIILDPDMATKLHADGWNVKQLAAREEDVDGDYYIQVSVSFKNKPPTVILLTSSGRKYLDRESISMLDTIDIKNIDLICNGYDWEVNGKGGVKAYLKKLFATLEEDELDRKYASAEPRGDAV